MKDKDKEFSKEVPADLCEPAPEEEGQVTAATLQEPAGELEEIKNRFAYLAAEFDNYRKRVGREKDTLVAFGNERLLNAILPFLDNLERAMSQEAGNTAAEGLLAGVRLTYDQFLTELRKFGLERICSEGEKFDPNLHEAIAQVELEGKPGGTVLSEARRGYLLNGRLLRPAQVFVAQERTGEAPGRGEGTDSGIPPGPGN